MSSPTMGAWECRHGVDGRDWCGACMSTSCPNAPVAAECDPHRCWICPPPPKPESEEAK